MKALKVEDIHSATGGLAAHRPRPQQDAFAAELRAATDELATLKPETGSPIPE